LISYRPFHNTDPPKLTELWNCCRLGPGAALEFANDALDLYVLSQPYFDKRGLIVACEGRDVIGFVHAGHGANASGTGVARETGVICALLVQIDRRRMGVGRELVTRAQSYLRESGARTIFAGESGRRDPFYLGLYGGAESAGFLDSDANATPFFTRLGYQPVERHLMFRRDIRVKKDPFDPRAVTIKRTMKFGVADRPPDADWWWMTRHGRFESLTFSLVPNSGVPSPAHITCWSMDQHAATRGERIVGLTDVFVVESERRKGLAKVLICEVIRRLREDLVTQVEVTINSENEPAIALFRSLGFEQVDAGTVFKAPDSQD
jgi:ribosomal protein S18 acetylase RimI-like enzyme